jgi:PKHD-type hydroxylase
MTNYWWGDDAIFKDIAPSLLEFYKKNKPQQGEIEGAKVSHIRRSRVVGIPFKHPSFDDIKKHLDPIVLNVNRHVFGYDLDGTCEFQLAEYSVGDKYDAHIDLAQTQNMCARKLSITVQLSEPDAYKGGSLEFTDNIPSPNLKNLGSVVVFPSFLGHKITPVTKGKRYSLVGWYNGPLWR